MITLNTFKKLLAKYGEYELSISQQFNPRGQKFFSGFVRNPDNNLVLYITSESCYNAHCENKMMVRYAEKIGDYSGARNHYIMPNNSGYFISQLLNSPAQAAYELGKTHA